MSKAIVIIAIFVTWLGSGLLIQALPIQSGQQAAIPNSPPSAIFARENLVAWCIVPFDAQRRGPVERAEMLTRLGIKRLAYDYRSEHVATFEQEIAALKAAGIELTAWWFPTELNAEARSILQLLKKHELHPQLWVMGSGEPVDNSDESVEGHLQTELARLAPIADAAAEAGCKVGLYNHGGWFGQPENQITLIKRLNRENIGIVYNLHHGHEHLDRFPELLSRIQPYLLCLNLNGMSPGADRIGRKIMPIGTGHSDRRILEAIDKSGYGGPIGILNHTDFDAEQRLQDNLNGLEWLTSQIEGRLTDPPAYTTWPGGVATQFVKSDDLNPDESKLVSELVDASRQFGNAERGLTVFAGLKTSCFSCHKLGRQGGTIGPDLTTISQLRTAEEIVASLYWPNRIVEDKYRATVVLRTDGTSIRGYLVNQDERRVLLRDPAGEVETIVPRDEIDEQRLGNSLMPDELMAALTRQQQLDLIRLLVDMGGASSLDLAAVDVVMSHAVAHRPEEFPWKRDPLEPDRWPSWQHYINRDRLYDFYTKQAEYFRTRPHGPLLSACPELDSGKYGHWGNQDEDSWRGDEWNDTILDSVHCGVFLGDGVTVARGICVRIGDDGQFATCFNPDTLSYELVWHGFIQFSDVRHGFMDGIHQQGETIERPATKRPSGNFEFHGFYRHGKRVIFAYRIGDTEYLDSPWYEDGKFTPNVGPRATHPLKDLVNGGPAQWPQQFQSAIRISTDSPYAIDTIELPQDNPWRANLYGGDHDFLADGSAMYATMTGDVWHVSGFSGGPNIDPDRLPRVATWRRFAAGLHQPLGLTVSDDGIFVMCRDQLLRLHDYNNDGEADFYECFSNRHQTSAAAHDYICGLHRDKQGNFYTASGNQGLVKISADGTKVESLATGFRNPDGVGLYPDGVVTVPCSEGDWTPASMICAIRTPSDARDANAKPPYFGHGGPRDGKMPELPMLYLPRGVDNSSGGQIFVTSDRWGPTKGLMVHFSYGMSQHFLILRDEVNGQLQAAAVPMPGEFLSGSHRGRFHPGDGQLYVTGMGGWGNYSPEYGCFQRVRFSGAQVQLPVGYHVYQNGIAIRYSLPLDSTTCSETRRHFAQCWNYRYSGNYGSQEYSAGHQATVGHDVLQIAGTYVLDDGRTLFVELPELQPVNTLHLRLNVDGVRGHDVFCTVHRMDGPRTDIPNYRDISKSIAKHPMELDLALVTRRKPNPWRNKIDGAREIGIQAGKNLTFSQTTIRAKSGEAIELRFTNPDAVPHNWVLLQPGSLDRVGNLTNKLIADPDAFLNHYVPPTDDVICYTDIAESNQEATIYFRAPDKPGRYPYLCTFPGHWMVMNGELIVE